MKRIPHSERALQHKQVEALQHIAQTCSHITNSLSLLQKLGAEPHAQRVLERSEKALSLAARQAHTLVALWAHQEVAEWEISPGATAGKAPRSPRFAREAESSRRALLSHQRAAMGGSE